jgi:Tol biopolymer transport system component
MRARQAVIGQCGRSIALLLLVLAASGTGQEGGSEASFITNVRQVTFEGRRAGEGYFSPDGSLMIFQSEREPGNPFFQIYLMDLETGDTHRVSPGFGKTTCAWIHPSMKRVLFASTHADPESRAHQKAMLELRASGKAPRYAWDYDPHYDIYVTDLDGKNAVRVTRERGYDAEGSFSPDGKLIAFSSNRHAYSEPLSPEDAKRFEHDKSFMLDLYIMNADGSNVRRLTNVKGYDGGPFFSPDGQRICFRRFHPLDPKKAEIYTIGIDGKDERQITHLGALSWAPFYHPSGDYLIFSTNKHGFKNFELYLVDVNGAHEPVRVTTTPDGDHDLLPVFFPDGKRLAWTATRSGNKKGQIFFADWNDAHARRVLGLDMPDLTRTRNEVRAEDIALHVRHLASARMGGRATGSEGERLAGEYIARVFEQFGLAPAGENGTYFQSFTFTAGVKATPLNALARAGSGSDHKAAGDISPPPERFRLWFDWRPLAFSKSGMIEAADVIFAGYGMAASAVGEHPAYRSLDGLDVKGKWVMVLAGAPKNVDPAWRAHLNRHANPRFKAMVLREHGACGMLLVSGPAPKLPPESDTKNQEVYGLKFDASTAEMSIVAATVFDPAAGAILRLAGKDLGRLREKLDRGEWVDGFEIPGYRLEATVDLLREKRSGRNVLARLNAGSAPIASAVVFGAHYDHLGRGESGNSLARDDEKGKIHFGADDNASGVAGVLETAQWLASLKQRGKLPMKRDLIFAAWSGEEIGLLGSTRFVKSQGGLAGSSSINPPIVACLNLDMIGRLEQHLVLQGVGSSAVWRREIERRNAPVGLSVRTVNDSFLPTDSTPFYLRGVPVLSAFTGAHADYHTPRDRPDRLNYDGAARVTRLMALITRGLVVSDTVPDYVAQKEKPEGSRVHVPVALGTSPDYTETEVKGLKLHGVRKEGPADKAGVKAGDLVVKLAGQTVENIYDYMHAMQAMVPGKPYPIVVVREGKRVTLTIVPEPKE